MLINEVLDSKSIALSATENASNQIPYLGLQWFMVLPRIAADVRLEKRDFVAFGEGGLCLGCESCTYPHCGFGR